MYVMPSGRSASITAFVTAAVPAIVPASPTNTLGVTGIGEAGTIAATAAVTNAVIDAIRPLGVDFIDMPLTPMRVWQAIHNHDGPRDTEQGRAFDEHGGGAAGSGPTSPTEGGAQ